MTINLSTAKIKLVSLRNEIKKKALKLIAIRVLPNNSQVDFKNLKFKSETELSKESDSTNTLRIFGNNGTEWEFIKSMNKEELSQMSLIGSKRDHPGWDALLLKGQNLKISLVLYGWEYSIDPEKTDNNIKINKGFSYFDFSEKFPIEKVSFEFSQCNSTHWAKVSNQIRAFYGFLKEDQLSLDSKKFLKEIESLNKENLQLITSNLHPVYFELKDDLLKFSNYLSVE